MMLGGLGTRLGTLGAGLGTGGGSGPVLLPLTARLAFGDNSYGAQTGSIDYLQYTWNRMGCRGVPTLGMRQPRGGDRLTHLHDRFAPLAAVRGVVGTMNVENDLADALVTNDAAGGDVLLARADQLVTDARAVGSPIVLYKQPNTNTAIGSKAAAVTRFNSQIDSRAASDVWIFDQSAFFNPQDANDSGDGIHPTKAASAVRLGNGLGDLLASKFVSAGIFDAGGQLAGNFHTGWNMGVAGSVSNGSGCTVTESADFLRSQPSVPCRKLSISGTCTADPTSGASTGDIRLRFASPHAGGTNTIGKSVTAYCLIEITDSAGNDQQKLASLLFQAAQSSAFSKTFVPANGPWHDGKKYVGVFGIMPSLITAQSLTCNIDFIFRPLQEAGVDIEVRIAYLNCLYTDDVAYGPATNASAIFTSGRPALFALPTTTPSSGPLSVGGTLAVNGLARFIGGGLTRTYDAIRNGSLDVGDMAPATAAGAAVPYTIVAGDSGQTLACRNNASNSFGGGSSDNVSSTAIAVA